METLRNGLDKIIEIFCIVLMAVMTTLVTWQVITRYVFNNPSAVTEQLCQYLFIWLVLFGAAYIFGRREHMQITFVRDKLPQKIGIICDILQEGIIFIFTFGVLVIGGYLSVIKQMVQFDAALRIPIGVVYAAIPISGVFILFYSILNIKKIINTIKRES
ncbi:TRAP transporter small permease [Cetobacterium somerae]|uniref:TRAP transporter small permease n=1 Tax=Cetobacterium sp. NK01 TaxID=2993530 RepID=UPI002116914B|nr:TRAP transporter small permease [Cetobacterium sp. NK01]MCQ8212051.1 TRAP transporter small permease [Cetobacterium sp. NK01]